MTAWPAVSLPCIEPITSTLTGASELPRWVTVIGRPWAEWPMTSACAGAAHAAARTMITNSRRTRPSPAHDRHAPLRHTTQWPRGERGDHGSGSVRVVAGLVARARRLGRHARRPVRAGRHARDVRR